MKVCPQCDRTYHDDELNFCLMDGTALVDGGSQPTIAIAGGEPTLVDTPRLTRVEKPRRSGLFWAGVWLASMMTLVGAVLGGWFLYFLFTDDPYERTDRRREAKTQTTPRVTTPRSTSSPTPNSPETQSSSPSQNPASESEDEPIPVNWDTTAATFGTETGKRLTVFCPPGGDRGIIWGSDVYMTTSPICLAGVHAGRITMEDGGALTIEYRPGRPAYGSTTRNGITSTPYGEFPTSFIILDPQKATAN